MAYTKVNWVNGVTPENATTLGQMDQGIKDAHDLIAAASSIEYENAWSAGTAYQPGDVVVHNGVEYLAVNPSTGSAPQPAGGATAGMPPTIYDAKGDILVASANDTPARLPVGANGQVLTADSATATGTKWAPISAVPTLVNNRWLAVKAGAMVWDTIKVADVFGIQYGSIASTAPSQGIVVPLTTPWPSTHVVFLATAWPGSSWAGFGILGSLPNGLSNGYVAVASTASQPITITWVSFGT